MACEARVDVALLAAAHPVDGGAHVVVDAAARDTAQDLERVVVGVEEHLVGLQRVGAQQERSAVAELEVGDLQLGALARDDRPVLAPVELEGLARAEAQGHEGAASGGLLDLVSACRPRPREGRHAVVGTVEAEHDEVGVHLLQGPPLLARLGRLALEPARELVRERIELARADALGVPGLDRAGTKVLLDGVARQAGASGYLADGQLLAQCPPPDDTQCRHVNHSYCSLPLKAAG